MGHDIAGMIARQRDYSRKLEDLIMSSGDDIDFEVSQLDSQLTSITEKILTAELPSESELRTRIGFLKEEIGMRTKGCLSVERELAILCEDFESLLKLRGIQELKKQI